MLRITIAATEQWDEREERFVYTKEQTLQLEHSLVSISKWESKWHKPFLHTSLTYEELIDYIRCMTLTQNVSPETYQCITHSQIDEIEKYMNEPMTATTFGGDTGGKGSREIVTAEIIYYWMTALQIPFDPCQKWHISRLLTLIRVCSIKNSPQKKIGRKETASQYAAMNAARKKKLNTKG